MSFRLIFSVLYLISIAL